MNDHLAWAVIKTISYADVFAYPLSPDEIVHFLVSPRPYRRHEVETVVGELVRYGLVKSLEGKKPYYVLAGAKHVVNRKIRKKISQKKLRNVRKVIQLLANIPTIQLIGISGALARENATHDDDIDLFIVTKPHTLWITRLCVGLWLEKFGLRRKPNTRNVTNTICVNMVIDSLHMAIPFEERDLFCAYEVVQMKPYFMRSDTYQKFLHENRWVRAYLANSMKRSKKQEAGSKRRFHFFPFPILGSYIMQPLEFLARTLQLWYMSKRRTAEVVTSGYVRFHPQDARKWILKRYSRRLAMMERQFARVKTSRVFPVPLFEDVQEVPSLHD